MDDLTTPQGASLFYSTEHETFRDSVRRFVEKEIKPHVDAWETAGELPRSLHEKAAAIGLLQIGYPEDLGGITADGFMALIAQQELARAGAGGVNAGLMTHGIALPPVVRFGSPEIKQRVVVPTLAGKTIAALAVTEPDGGSDVANLKTRARRDGDHYIISGEKTYITSGMRADFLTVAVRTGGDGPGGVSVVLVETDRPGISRTALDKMGWHCSDTASIHFDSVKIPVSNLIGPENAGFPVIMTNFNAERLGMAAQCIGFARVCLDDTVDWLRQRQAFGKPLIAKQVLRHRLVDMAMEINAAQAWLEQLTWRVDQGQQPIAEICMLKTKATLLMEHCAREAVQMHGGAGYMRGNRVERIYREVRVNAIGGGAEEVMRDLASRQMGL